MNSQHFPQPGPIRPSGVARPWPYDEGDRRYAGKQLLRRTPLEPTVVPMQPPGQERHRVLTFMAECFWPGVTVQNVVDAGDRARHASLATSSGDSFVRYLGSILVPTDEIALCLFEAASIDAAAEVNRRAGIPSERILEIVRLGGSAVRPSSRTPLNSSAKELR
jgi:uncharacterized protein DUF4242